MKPQRSLLSRFPKISFACVLAIGLFCPRTVSATDLRVKVLDPQSAAVAGARVSVYRAGENAPVETRTTAGNGEVLFQVQLPAGYRVQVLAAGFAEAWMDSQSREQQASPAVIRLQVASASETVVVSATRTPVPEDKTAVSVSLVSSAQLETMQPVAYSDVVRFLPGAVVNVAGQRGGLGSLFVEGGDSRYNKVIVDDVPVNDPGGTFNFATVPVVETDRVEFLRGAQSTLYGSDAMNSVVETSSQNGTTEIPELRLAADGGNFGTAHGFASLAGARSHFDYDAFADQFNSNGQGPNADYTNALQGGNFGVQFNQRVLFRLRLRHSNSRTGVPGEWDFNGARLLPPDLDQRARANNFLASAELSISAPGNWQHQLVGYEYNTRRLNEDNVPDRGCDNSQFLYIDCPFTATAHINRAGFMYHGSYTPRTWAQTTVGYEFEDENARLFNESITLDSQNPPSIFISYTPALRLNHAAYVQQRVTWKRLTALAGVRYVHNETFGNWAVPRVALAYQMFKGGAVFSGTRLRFAFAEGIKEARFEEEYAGPPFSIPNLHLKPEQNREFETGFEQELFSNRYLLSAIYFNNSFHDQIDYLCCNALFEGQYVNLNTSIAHGTTLTFSGKIKSRIQFESGYTYLSSQILQAPSETGLQQAGQPLLRRPKHSGNFLVTYLGSRWGASMGGSFVGRRTDSDFLGFGIDHAAGYTLANVGGWYSVNRHITAYVSVDNALNQHYNEVVGYPALTANFRAGLRFRIGGE